MPDVLVVPDSSAGRADVTDSSGVHAIIDAAVRARQVARRLVVLRGPPNVDRILMLSGSIDVEICDLDPVESPVQVLLPLAGGELAS